MRGPYGPPASWTIKPPLGSQLNAGHDLAIGLQDLFLFNERGGKTANNLGPSGVGALTSSAFNWPTGQMPYGGGLAVGASGQSCATPFTATVPTQVSMVLVFQRTATTAANGIMATMRQSGTANNQVSFQYDATPTNLNILMSTSANALKDITIPLASIAINTWCVLAASFDRAAGTISAVLNSTAFSGSPGVASAVATTAHALSVGGTATGTVNQGITVAMFARYNRLLAAQEAAQLVDNPWCMIAPPALRRYWVVSGSVANAQTLAATQGTTPAMVRGTGKLVAASQGSTPTLIKGVRHGLTASQGSSPTLLRGIGHILSATQGTTPTLTKGRAASMAATQVTSPALICGAGKTITATQATTPLLARGVGKAISATQSTTAALLALKTKIVTLTATQGTTATMGRSVGKVLTAVQAATVTMQRGIGHGLSATQGTSASLSKGRAATLATMQSTSATVARGTGKSLQATQGSTVQMRRAIGKTMAAVQASTVTLTKGLAHTLSATQGSSAVMLRGIGKVLVATQAHVVTIVGTRSGGTPFVLATATLTMVLAPIAVMTMTLVPTATMEVFDGD